MTSTARTWPRFLSRLPISARLILAIVGLFALTDLGIIVSVWWGHRREQRIIQKLKEWDGRVYSWTREEGPDWLRRLVGDEQMQVFERVDRVHFYEGSVPLSFCQIFFRLVLSPAAEDDSPASTEIARAMVVQRRRTLHSAAPRG